MATGNFRRGCDSWRRFHLRNLVPISVALAGTMGANLVVLLTLGWLAVAGSWALLSLAYLAGLVIPSGRLS